MINMFVQLKISILAHIIFRNIKRLVYKYILFTAIQIILSDFNLYATYDN